MGITIRGGAYEVARIPGTFIDAEGRPVDAPKGADAPMPTGRPESLDDFTVAQVIEMVTGEDAVLTPAEAMELEVTGRERATLIQKLRELIQEG